jgi:hypothetical protein
MSESTPRATRRGLARLRGSRGLLVGLTAALVVTAVPVAIGAGEGEPVEGGERNPSFNPALNYTSETEIISSTSTYGTRQSNKSTNGGGAIYGCRSIAGGSAANNEPCIRANNLNVGSAFEFKTGGVLGGRIDTKGGPDTKPFETNATGVATGLNADRIDGLEGKQLQERWALVDETGKIVKQIGGIEVVDCYTTNNNCYLKIAGEDVRNNAISAQIAVQNVADIQGDDVNLSGEAGTAPCGETFVACAPPNTETNEVFVVAPRKSDGTATAAGARLRFYVFVSGSESTTP